MCKELSGYFNSIKMIQLNINVTLIEIKKNLQGTNRGGDEAGIQINYLEHKEEISIQSEQQEEIRIQKNKDSIRALWTSPNVPTSES